MANTLESEPSNYMQTLTRYLSNIMNSTLLGLPREIKELIYFDALSHAANMILVRHLPSPSPQHTTRSDIPRPSPSTLPSKRSIPTASPPLQKTSPTSPTSSTPSTTPLSSKRISMSCNRRSCSCRPRTRTSSMMWA